MRLWHVWPLCSLLALTSLSGCDSELFSSDPSDPLMSKKAIATRETPEEQVFQGELGGKPVFLLTHDCEVFLVERKEGGGVQWTSVLELEFYPLWTSCLYQPLTFDGVGVTARLGRQAFSAGGCCTGGSGSFRTVDGRTWKRIRTVP